MTNGKPPPGGKPKRNEPALCGSVFPLRHLSDEGLIHELDAQIGAVLDTRASPDLFTADLARHAGELVRRFRQKVAKDE